jgi:cytochrome c2
MKRLLYGIVSLVLLVVMTACGGRAEVDESLLPTRVPTLAAEAFAAPAQPTAIPEVAPAAEVTTTATITEPITEAAPLVETTEVTATEELTATAELTETAEVSAGPEITATEAITATDAVTTPVEAAVTEAVTEAVTATAELTETVDVSAGPEIGATEAITASDVVTTPADVAAGEEVTMTEEITNTEEVTDTAEITDMEDVAATEEITATEPMTTAERETPAAAATTSPTDGAATTPEDELPADVAAALADADPDHGQQLTLANACIACHAFDPNQVMVGPTWYNIGNVAATRVPGESAEVYLYNSIVHPNAYVVEGYQPNIMLQIYGTLSAQDKADMIAYLLAQKQGD